MSPRGDSKGSCLQILSKGHSLTVERETVFGSKGRIGMVSLCRALLIEVLCFLLLLLFSIRILFI